MMYQMNSFYKQEIHWLSVSATNPQGNYSGNIKMSDVNHVKLDINVLSYSVVFIKKMNLLSENFQASATDVFM